MNGDTLDSGLFGGSVLGVDGQLLQVVQGVKTVDHLKQIFRVVFYLFWSILTLRAKHDNLISIDLYLSEDRVLEIEGWLCRVSDEKLASVCVWARVCH